MWFVVEAIADDDSYYEANDLKETSPFVIASGPACKGQLAMSLQSFEIEHLHPLDATEKPPWSFREENA